MLNLNHDSHKLVHIELLFVSLRTPISFSIIEAGIEINHFEYSVRYVLMKFIMNMIGYTC